MEVVLNHARRGAQPHQERLRPVLLTRTTANAQRGKSESLDVDPVILEDTVARPNTITQLVARIRRVGSVSIPFS